jgi:hypothetical protein
MAAAEFAPLADALASDHTVLTYDPRRCGDGSGAGGPACRPGAHAGGTRAAAAGTAAGCRGAAPRDRRDRRHVPHPGLRPRLAPTGQQLAEAARFFEHELRPTCRYLPDIPALSAGKVVVGIGEDSGHLITYRTSVALAELLGVKPLDFPGDHGGFLGAPAEFADRLRELLS